MRRSFFAALLAALLPGVTFAQSTDDQALLQQYCIGCHNGRTLAADLSLQDVDPATAGHETTDLWEKVVRKLRTRAMPPPGRPRPEAAAYDGFLARLEGTIDGASAAAPNPGRRPAVHRLNRAAVSYTHLTLPTKA